MSPNLLYVLYIHKLIDYFVTKSWHSFCEFISMEYGAGFFHLHKDKMQIRDLIILFPDSHCKCNVYFTHLAYQGENLELWSRNLIYPVGRSWVKKHSFHSTCLPPIYLLHIHILMWKFTTSLCRENSIERKNSYPSRISIRPYGITVLNAVTLNLHSFNRFSYQFFFIFYIRQNQTK